MMSLGKIIKNAIVCRLLNLKERFLILPARVIIRILSLVKKPRMALVSRALLILLRADVRVLLDE
jgi:hypothetical protein